MKHFSKMLASVIACAAVLSCVAPCMASADVDMSVPTELFSSDPYVSFSALGYTPDQIQTIMAGNITPNQFLAYCNYDPNIGYTGGMLTQVMVEHPVTISCNGYAHGSLFDGYGEYESAPFFNQPASDIYHLLDYDVFYFTTNTANLNEYQFPNLIRFKYTGSNVNSFTVSCTQNSSPAFLTGTVEAGNVSRYISGSTDTGSIINSDDATLVLQHFGNMMAGIADPNWTYAASVAADVNCDNQVNAVDAMLISNRLLGTLFWPDTPVASS
ncbi:MAG: dockerin type I repeat-containing protein [Oscillospiraceae bacterium]|nr:dockerin type I repeat-containing protein [Oscillospiraceae bacterium]